MKTISEKQRKLTQQDRPDGFHIQTYATHPFIDIYAAKCDKGIAYENILSHIARSERKDHRIMYLGDSENDNPAFRKANISIGVRSDERLNPNLDCRYTVNFDKLASLRNSEMTTLYFLVCKKQNRAQIILFKSHSLLVTLLSRCRQPFFLSAAVWVLVLIFHLSLL